MPEKERKWDIRNQADYDRFDMTKAERTRKHRKKKLEKKGDCVY